MLFVKIIVGLFLALAVIIVAFVAIHRYIDSYNKFCQQRFGTSVLNVGSFFGAGFFAIVFYVGVRYYRVAVATHQDLSDGLALLGFGGFGIALTVAICIYLTNRFYGVISALILLAGGIIVAPVSIALILVAIFGGGRTIFIVKE